MLFLPFWGSREEDLFQIYMPFAATASFPYIHVKKEKKPSNFCLLSNLILPILFSIYSTETALLKVTTDLHISNSNSHFSGLILCGLWYSVVQ